MGVRWGILSTAAINDLVLAGARESDRVDVVAVASRDTARAEAYARTHGIETAHGSYEALLGDADVEAVYIPLPNSLHVDWTVRALDAGKHVLVEKPFSRRAAEVARAGELAVSRGLVLSEAFMWRYHPQTARMLELVAQGAVGRLVLVRAAFSFSLAALRGHDDTRFDPDLDGGGMMDVGCYCVSGIRLLTGSEPERVFAEERRGGGGVDVAAAGTLRMPDDALGHFDCGFVTQHRDELEVVGEEGSLFVDDPWHCREPGIELRTGSGVEHIPVEAANSYRLELEAVSDAIRGKAPLRFGPEDAVAQARVIEALYRSAVSGRSVDLAEEDTSRAAPSAPRG